MHTHTHTLIHTSLIIIIILVQFPLLLAQYIYINKYYNHNSDLYCEAVLWNLYALFFLSTCRSVSKLFSYDSIKNTHIVA